MIVSLRLTKLLSYRPFARAGSGNKVLLNILRFTTAAECCFAARTCRLLNAVATGGDVWRAFYTARWGAAVAASGDRGDRFVGRGDRHVAGAPWYSLYSERTQHGTRLRLALAACADALLDEPVPIGRDQHFEPVMVEVRYYAKVSLVRAHLWVPLHQHLPAPKQVEMGQEAAASFGAMSVAHSIAALEEARHINLNTKR